MLNRCTLIIFWEYVSFNDTNYDLPVFLPRQYRIPQCEHPVWPPGDLAFDDWAALKTVAASSDSSY